MMTLTDVAERAGVSVATVSRVINGRPTVTPKVARHVKQVMAEIGYVPAANRRGRKPGVPPEAGRQLRTIGLLLLGRSQELLDQPSMGRVLGGMLEAGRSLHADTVVLEMPDVTQMPRRIRNGEVDGLVVLGQQPQPEWLDIFHPVPMVALGGEPLDVPVFDQVAVNDRAVARLAVDYLRGRGCRRLGFLNHDSEHAAFVSRGNLFAETAVAGGATVSRHELPERAIDEAEMWTTARLRADFSELIEQMLAAGNRLPEGVFVPTDQQAAMLHALLRERGLGEGMVTISCNNDNAWLSAIHPRPATIALRAEERGRLAVERLVQRIRNPGASPVVTLVTPRLVTGEEG